MKLFASKLCMALFFSATFRQLLWILLRRFGAFAFFPLGLLDMSVVPAPGSFDALLILLTATQRELWWYYALMATAGSAVGAWPTFRLGRKGGEKALEKKLSRHRVQKIFSSFQRWGFWSIFLGAIAPPPMPASAIILAAGALEYPWLKFNLAWIAGRLLRFGLAAWITARYGRHIFRWLHGFYQPALWLFIVIGVAAGAVALWFYVRQRRRASADRPQQRAA